MKITVMDVNKTATGNWRITDTNNKTYYMSPKKIQIVPHIQESYDIEASEFKEKMWIGKFEISNSNPPKPQSAPVQQKEQVSAPANNYNSKERLELEERKSEAMQRCCALNNATSVTVGLSECIKHLNLKPEDYKDIFDQYIQQKYSEFLSILKGEKQDAKAKTEADEPAPF